MKGIMNDKKSGFWLGAATVIMLVAIGVILLTNGQYGNESKNINNGESSQKLSGKNEYDAEQLIKLKTPYVGNNSKVVRIIDNLPLANLRKDVSLNTDNKPYGISVIYDFSFSSMIIEAIENLLRHNAIVIFALIENVDVINFNFYAGGEQTYQYTRGQLQQSFDQDLRAYAKDVQTFDMLLNSIGMKFYAYPEKYATTMSSTPGIRILVQFNEIADKVQYSTAYGKLLGWDRATGNIKEFGQNVEMPVDIPVYWSPPENESLKVPDKISVKAVIFNKKVSLAEKQMNIKLDSSTHFYTVEASNDVIITASK